MNSNCVIAAKFQESISTEDFVMESTNRVSLLDLTNLAQVI